MQVRETAAAAPASSERQASTARVYSELEREEQRFVLTLEKGESLLDELLTKAAAAGAEQVCMRLMSAASL